MLTRLWCWLFGHKRYEKAFTGQYFDTYDALTRQPIKGTLYFAAHGAAPWRGLRWAAPDLRRIEGKREIAATDKEGK